MRSSLAACMFFFFNDTATTEIYTLSLHDALPISAACPVAPATTRRSAGRAPCPAPVARPPPDRKSTRLNSSHSQISYAVFCLKKKTLEDWLREHAGMRRPGMNLRGFLLVARAEDT